MTFPIVDREFEDLPQYSDDRCDLDLAHVRRNGLHAVRAMLTEYLVGAVAYPVIS